MIRHFESSHQCKKQDVKHPVHFICLGKYYDEEKEETSQHQEVFKIDKQEYITEESVEYPAKKLNVKINTNEIIMGINSEKKL